MVVMYYCLLSSQSQCNVSTNTSYHTHIIIHYSLCKDGANVTSEDSHLVQLHPTNNIVLSCVFTGVPLPTVTWYHNGSPHQHGRDGVTITTTNNSSELTVVRSGGQREGVYTCTATNTLGTSSLEFTVECEYTVCMCHVST